MMFRMEMYLLWLKSLLRVCVDTMMFLVCSSRRITSKTVVLRTLRTQIGRQCARQTAGADAASGRASRTSPSFDALV